MTKLRKDKFLRHLEGWSDGAIVMGQSSRISLSSEYTLDKLVLKNTSPLTYFRSEGFTNDFLEPIVALTNDRKTEP